MPHAYRPPAEAVLLCLLPWSLGSLGPQEPVPAEEPVRTPRIESFTLHRIADQNSDSVDDLLIVSRWGYVEDYGLPAQQTSFETLNGDSGEALARHDWAPVAQPQFDVRTAATLRSKEGSSELIAFEHETASRAGRSSYTFSIRSADGQALRLMHTSEELEGRAVRPVSISPTGDFDGDGRADVFVLALSWDAAKKVPGVGNKWFDDLGFVHSSQDGRVLDRLKQPEEYGTIYFGLSGASGNHDVTGDRTPDVVVAGLVPMHRATGEGIVLVYSGKTMELHKTLGPFPNHAQFGRIDASTDIDGDGANDIAFSALRSRAEGGCTVRVSSGKTGGTLLEFDTPHGGESDVLFVDDVNGDGVDDIFALVRKQTKSLRSSFHGSLHSGTTGEILAQHELTDAGGIASPARVKPTLLGDVDGDGREEIALAYRRHASGGKPSAHALAVLSGADLTPRYARVLAGLPLRPGPEATEDDWRSRIDRDAPLTPPSLELVQSWPEMPFSEFESLEALREFRAGMEKVFGNASAPEEAQRSLMFAPEFMRRLVPYYHESPWTGEEAAWITELCGLLAVTAAEPDLVVEGTTSTKLGAALQAVKAWWEWGCEDNDFIADLVIYLNDGPFHGATVPTNEVSGLLLLASVELEADGGRVELFSGDDPPRLYLRHARTDGTLSWCRRLTTGEGQEASAPAGLSPGPVPFQPGFGWSVGGFVSWSAGRESATFHIDLEGNLRFYELSW